MFCCCITEQKAGHTNAFSKTLVYLFLFSHSLETQKNNEMLSVSLVAKCLSTVDLHPCLLSGLQLHLFHFSSEDFLCHFLTATKTPSHVWEMSIGNQKIGHFWWKPALYPPPISSQPSWGYIWYHVANPGVSFPFSLQKDRKISCE